MITTLHIKNIGIIDEINIELGSGFNVFTGETGAGKTLIIDAINIISGGRFSKEMIRKGEEFSFVELNLYLPTHKESIENNIIISREIHTNGRNSCKINGRLVTVKELKDFMKNIIDIHGQNDNQKILDSNYHIEYIDNFAENDIKEIINDYRKSYQRYCQIKRELKDNLGDEKEKQRQLDLLQYEFDEINSANLKIGEEEILKEKSILFENAEKIESSIAEAKSNSESSVDTLNRVIRSIERLSEIDTRFTNKLEEIRSIYYEVEEFNRDLSYMNDEYEFNEGERDEVEERLDLISFLKRKYGNSIEEIIEYKNNIEKEIERINNLEGYNNKLRCELRLVEEKMETLSKELNSIRERYAIILNEKINKELIELEMPNAIFKTIIEKTKEYNNNGKNKVQFFISTNIGENKKELSKIASGGEMSRIMLAIKTVLADTDNTPIMIFDEIDTGISGKAAKAVSRKLRYIGNKHQVICITHQPSIAAKGENNYFISKKTIEYRTFTKIRKLNEDETINEIARISNGDITDIAIKHAIELRKLA